MKNTYVYKQPFLINNILVTACLSAVLVLTGCKQEGSAEKAGQKIDRAAAKVQQQIEQVTEQANQKIETAQQSLDKNADNAGASIYESTSAAKGSLNEAGQNIEQVTEKIEQKFEGTKESVIDKAKTTGEYIDDSVITATVKTAIFNDSLLRASHIEVTTVKGVVNLSGTVDSEQSIGRALELANNQKNVKSVKTNLIVNASTSSKQ